MALYERACPWGQFEPGLLPDALNDLEVPRHNRRLMRRLLPVIHREIKKFNRPKAEG